MTGESDVRTDGRLRERVLEAALDELAAADFGSFSLEAAAGRVGVEVSVVRQMWPNSAELAAAALMDFGGRHLPVPDTGNIHGDLLAYAKSFAAMVESALGRRLLDAVIARPADWDLSATRPAFLQRRDQRMSLIIRRAIGRGECLPDTEPGRLIDLIAFGVSLPILLYDRQISDEDCEFVVNTVMNGIRPR